MVKKIKKIQLPTKFNYATARFEPVLPVKNKIKRPNPSSWTIWDTIGTIVALFALLVLLLLIFS